MAAQAGDFVEAPLDLLCALLPQRLDGDRAPGQFVRAEHQGECRTARVSALELGFEAALPFGAGGVHLHAEPRLAQLTQGAQHDRGGGRVGHDGIDVGPGLGNGGALLPEQFQHALDADRPADGRGRLAAHLDDEIVVAPPGTDRTLGAEAVGDELEHREVVVVQAAHQARVDGVGDAVGVQDGAQAIEVGERLLAEEIHEPGRRIHHGLHRGVLGVQDAQRVGMQAALAVLVEQVRVPLEVGDELLAVARALRGLAEAVEFEPHIGEPDGLPERIRQQDQFRIDVRPCEAQCLGADLVELPETSALRLLAAEHGAGVPEALGTVVEHVVLDGRAHHAGGVLGPQAEVVVVAVFVGTVVEGVHLLLDDVGDFADAADEQRGVLQDGRADVAVGELSHEAAHLALQPFPAGRLGRQDVVHAFDGGEFGGPGGRCRGRAGGIACGHTSEGGGMGPGCGHGRHHEGMRRSCPERIREPRRCCRSGGKYSPRPPAGSRGRCALPAGSSPSLHR